MSTEKKNFRKGRKGEKGEKGEKSQRPSFTPEQRLEHKLDNARKDDHAVVPRRALDTSSFLGIMTKFDYLVDRLRKRLELDDSVDVEKAVQALRKGRELREELNRLNMEMCDIMQLEYRPPRDFMKIVAEIRRAAKAQEDGGETKAPGEKATEKVAPAGLKTAPGKEAPAAGLAA